MHKKYIVNDKSKRKKNNLVAIIFVIASYFWNFGYDLARFEFRDIV